MPGQRGPAPQLREHRPRLRGSYDSVRRLSVVRYGMRPPVPTHWLFWDVDVDTLDTDQHPSYILARVLERGRLQDVKWAISAFGIERIHEFFRDAAHPEISARTRSFWRAFFKAGDDETWAQPPDWRRSSAIPWPP